MKKLLLLLPLTLLLGCSTTNTGVSNNEENAKQAAAWVNQRAGYIEAAVQTATHVIVYSVEKDTVERAELLATLNTVSINVNTLIEQGKVDPFAVRQALKVKETYVDGILQGIAAIYSAEAQNVKDNGYGALVVEILKAVSAGIAAGSVQ